MNHPDPIRRVARTDPARPCVVVGERTLTFADVDDRADRAASAWLDLGLAPGERVAVLAHNEAEYLELQVAAQRSGLVLVPLNTRLATPELRRIVADAAPSLLLHGPDLAGAARAAADDVPWVWRLGGDPAGGDGPGVAGPGGGGADGSTSYETRLAAVAVRRRWSTDPDALATLLYTSGTTGTARGAMITNRVLLARSLALATDLRLGAGDVFLQCLPMFHLAQTFTHAFATVGATSVQLRTFDPAAALAAIARHRVTHTLVVPTIIAALLDRPELPATDLTSLRGLLYGASPISPSALTAALAAFDCDFHQMYGMTETGPATLLRPAQHDPGRPELLTAVGSEIVTVEIDVVDPDGIPTGPGVDGEIVVSGPTVMAGYWRAPEASAATIRDGVLHTGDIGRIDDRGLLRITDRLKDMIITGGENVVPREVEEVLLAHPAVAACAVIGLPDGRYGERVHAVVVPASPGTEPDPAALTAFCRERLAGYKQPRSWEWVEDLPRTATGKVQRHRLRARTVPAPLDIPRGRAPHPTARGALHA